MRQLFRFLNDYKKECILAPLFKLFEATLELFVPLVMAAIIDHGIDGADIGFIGWLGAILVLRKRRLDLPQNCGANCSGIYSHYLSVT